MATETMLPPRFRDARRVGRGGMGDILLAVDSQLDREVAIKVLAERYAEDPAIRARFKREALAAARLSGIPNAVTIFDVGDAGGHPYIVMEYLSGGSLEERLRAGPVAQEEALQWLDEAARALDAAHERGIVHRDVKPGNLLLDHAEVVHVADFGVARAAGLDSLTVAGTVLGTAGYLSPEQARGEAAEPASDRYALAVVAFELLTGERPFERDTTAAEAAAHVHEPVPSIRERDPSLPPAVDDVFQRALAKAPDARFPTCRSFVSALGRALAAPTAETRVAPAPRPARQVRYPWRIPVIALLLAAAAIAGALVAATLVGDGEERSGTPSVVTREGERVTVTQTAEAPPPPPPPATTPPPTPPQSGEDGVALTDQATRLMRAGRYAEALPIAQQALARLRGSGQLYEAYANYNVGRSLIELGRCDEGLPYIDASERIQGHRSEFDEARAKCRAG